jgi:hypothetical protein
MEFISCLAILNHGDYIKVAKIAPLSGDTNPPDIKFRMKKRIITDALPSKEELNSRWLDLEVLAEVEVTSEDKGYPIEGALLPNQSHGWKAGIPGKQTIRLLFNQTQTIKHIHLCFLENDLVRTQEYVLRCSHDNGLTFEEIVRQQWNFSPDGSNKEVEDHLVAISNVSVLELIIIPDINNENVLGSLEQLRLA